MSNGFNMLNLHQPNQNFGGYSSLLNYSPNTQNAMGNIQGMVTPPQQNSPFTVQTGMQIPGVSPGSNMGNVVTPGRDWGSFLFGGKDNKGNMSNGVVGTSIGALTGLAGAWSGMQQLKLGKQQLAFQKESFAKNWENQTKMINTKLRDRQKARVAFSDKSQDVDSYMKENGVQ